MVRIRQARRADAQAAWDIRRLAVRARCADVYSPAEIAAWTAGEPGEKAIARVARDFHVAVDDERVVATGMLTAAEGDAAAGKVDAIFVHPLHMGRGIARQMMTFIEALALARGMRVLTLDATLNAAPFYRRCGFVGDAVSVHVGPTSLSLACVPMRKTLDAT
ncbi:MAG: GNAT family N-acetyltransferase [Janthinobacterium lividum]